MNSRQAWKFNMWVSLNFGWILWGILTVSTLLQQFPHTEPLVLGFWWITIVCFVGGPIAGQMFGGRVHNPMNVYVNIGVQVLGVLLQMYLVVCHWQTLCQVDDALRIFRSNLMRPIGADHLLPLRLVWIGFTIDFWAKRLRRGFLFCPVAYTDG